MPVAIKLEYIPLSAAELQAAGAESSADIARVVDTHRRKMLALKEIYRRALPPPPGDTIKVSTMAMAERQQARLGTCPAHYLHGSDAAGHNFAKELHCGAEWCPVCGKKNSAAHNRRFARWVPKAQQLKRMGYFVIEWPLQSRDKLRNSSALSLAGITVKGVLSGEYELKKRRRAGTITNKQAAELKSRYYNRGLRRWHFFGDIEHELSHIGIKWLTPPPADDTEFAVQGCSAFISFKFRPTEQPPTLTLPTLKTNIHLNVLVEAGYLPKGWLRHIQYNLREALHEPNLIVHYGYTKQYGQMVHILKYVTRATFLDINWDKWLAGQLYGFRNMHSWGVWSGPELWSLTELTGAAAAEVAGLDIKAINSLGESRCYLDGLPIRWSKPRPIHLLADEPIKQELGAGYYRLADTPPTLPLQENTRMRWQRYLVKVLHDGEYEAELARLRAGLDDTGMCYALLEERRQHELSLLQYELDRVRLYTGTQYSLALGSYEDATLGEVANPCLYHEDYLLDDKHEAEANGRYLVDNKSKEVDYG